MCAYRRDPISELLDRGARQLLERAYAERAGTWVMTRLADPGAEHIEWARRNFGIALMAPDEPATDSGTASTAHTRWGRAFIRALYYQHKWFGDAKGIRAQRRMQPYGRPLQVEWGRRLPARGIIPAGRAIRVRVAVGGQTAQRVVRAKPDRQRIYDDDGNPAARHADPEKRDWS